jgi:hypothetical protein
VAAVEFSTSFSFSSFSSDSGEPLSNRLPSSVRTARIGPEARARKRIAQLETLDKSFRESQRRVAGVLDENKTMTHVSRAGEEVIKALRGRLVANHEMYEQQLQAKKIQLEVENGNRDEVLKDLAGMVAERDLCLRQNERLQKDMHILTFTVKQLQRTYKSAAMFHKEKKETSDVEIQCDLEKELLIAMTEIEDADEKAAKESNLSTRKPVC